VLEASKKFITPVGAELNGRAGCAQKGGNLILLKIPLLLEKLVWLFKMIVREEL